jgi:hypothetical protein
MRAEPAKPIMIEIGGKEYQLRYSLRSLRELETQGVNLLEQSNMNSISKLSLLLYHGLRTENPNISEEWVLDNVDAPELFAMLPAMVEAATGKRGQAETVAAKNEPARFLPGAAGTGGNPGLSEDTISPSVKPNSGI